MSDLILGLLQGRAWTEEETEAVRLMERQMQIANGTVWDVLVDKWARAFGVIR